MYKCIQKYIYVCAHLFCNLRHCSAAGSSVHGIIQARILEWVAISYSNICRHTVLILISHRSAWIFFLINKVL